MQQPPQPYEHPKATDILQSLSWVFLMAVYATGVFWALLVKKLGTVGTRAYFLDFSGGFLLLLALSQNPWPYDQFFFVSSLILLVIMLLWHMQATLNSPVHVHTKCIGHSRFLGKGKRPETMELVTGLLVAGLFVLFGLVPYGFFIFASASANFIRDGMIQERDRLRSVQMADAMWEQEYMMNNFDQWKRGSHG